ncbi:LCP family protein [Caldisalinibacter kiritimatiensis]|uniref:Cell envelope-associated transcriptional attenuator LytR-CpsA-Psr, subfamily M n=1 Tax=Caldisalinibacter kiritimatiensis TaxID=1304284 RepID=R1AUL7_9FIRM|nr:LCP family protein [Caldisalinibacter kiritimatiensis]EOD00337.1 Cell envelope-associated transcriptional attenuator LytR-CpsA-Psr, subfamily M [Caldisalinibacter kiritimatiensis]
MKHFFKVFSIVFLCCLLALGSMFAAFLYFSSAQAGDNNSEQTNISENASEGGKETESEESKEPDDPLQKAIKESKRLNVLLLGLEGPRTDTIIFASFDPVTKKVDMISIPRDTYWHREGFDEADKRKINAVYGDWGVNGTKRAIESLLGGVPIHHYVKVTYKGVEEIVDSLGGVEVNVPFHMKYEDPTDDPPLVIDIPKGHQLLNGEQAVKFLRFRKSNDGKTGYRDGDLGRIRAQQQFIKSAIRKSLSYRLPIVARTVYKYVKTDVGITDVMKYVNDVIGIKLDNVSMTTLPGRPIYKFGLSYYSYDKDKVRELIMDIYNAEDEQDVESAQ